MQRAVNTQTQETDALNRTSLTLLEGSHTRDTRTLFHLREEVGLERQVHLIYER